MKFSDAVDAIELAEGQIATLRAAMEDGADPDTADYIAAGLAARALSARIAEVLASIPAPRTERPYRPIMIGKVCGGGVL